MRDDDRSLRGSGTGKCRGSVTEHFDNCEGSVTEHVPGGTGVHQRSKLLNVTKSQVKSHSAAGTGAGMFNSSTHVNAGIIDQTKAVHWTSECIGLVCVVGAMLLALLSIFALVTTMS